MKKLLITATTVIGLIVAVGVSAFAANLGAGSNFAALSTGGSTTLGGTFVSAGEVGGINIDLSGTSTLAADAIASDADATHVGIRATNSSVVAGQCVTGGSLVTLLTGSTCGSKDTTGTNPLLTTMASAVTAAQNFSRSQQNRTPNQAFGSVIIPTSGSFTINTTVPGGTTVVDMADLKIGASGGSGTLTINGASGDYMLINIFGAFSMFGPGSSIALSGGITADHVVFNVICTGTSVETVSSGSVVINGTIVALGRRCDLGSTTLNGQIICGQNVSMNPISTLNFIPLGTLP